MTVDNNVSLVRRETELELLQQDSRDPAGLIRVCPVGQPLQSALVLLRTPYLAYRERIGDSVPELLEVSRRSVNDDDLVLCNDPIVAFQLPEAYPDEAPLWKMLTRQVANPAVLGDQICFFQGWSCHFTILKVITSQLIPLLRCQPGSWDPKHPLNPALSDWIVHQQKFQLPLNGPAQSVQARPRIRRIR